MQVIDSMSSASGTRLATPSLKNRRAKMAGMSRFRSTTLIGALGLTLSIGVSCSRPLDVPTDEGSAQAGQTPFHDDTSPLAESTALHSSEVGPENRPPFQNAQNVPAGTLLMVRLKNPISAAKGAQNSFVASIDEPVIVEGNTLIPRGAVVSGHVESARLSDVKPGRGYVRLALQSVQVSGVDLPLHTASLFVRQSSPGAASGSTVHLDKGHRLTFRLMEPAFTASQISRGTR